MRSYQKKQFIDSGKIPMTVFCAFVTLCGLFLVEEIPHPYALDRAFVTVYDTAVCVDDEECINGNGDGYFANMELVTDDAYLNVAA